MQTFPLSGNRRLDSSGFSYVVDVHTDTGASGAHSVPGAPGVSGIPGVPGMSEVSCFPGQLDFP